MKNFIVILLLTVLCFATNSVSAQNEVEKERQQFKVDALQEMKENQKLKRTIEFSTSKSIKNENSLLAVTAADVGEPDSFGKNALFLGTAVSGTVFTHPTCNPTDLANDGYVLTADDRCVVLTNSNVLTDVTFNDIGRITIPARTVNNTVWYVANHTKVYFIQNSTSGVATGNISYIPSITIESEALLDPTAIDPTTGNPMNGSYTTGIGSKSFGKTYQAGDFESMLDRYSLAATRGLARGFWSDLGLSQTVINNIYKKPMTIKLNLRARFRLAQDAQFFYTMRFFGN
jgi:hypothetical protein